MMTAEKELLQAVEKLERDLQAQKPQMERQLAEAERQRLRLLAEHEVISRAAERRCSFNPVLGRGYQCPSCWIRSETRTRLRVLPGTDGGTVLICDACRFRLAVETDAA